MTGCGQSQAEATPSRPQEALLHSRTIIEPKDHPGTFIQQEPGGVSGAASGSSYYL